MKHARIINLPKNPKHIFEEAIMLGSENWVDEKGTEDHPSVWQREPSKLSFEEAFNLIQPFKPHWVCIFRNESYLTGREEDDYWDFGGCNIASNDYGEVFIWIKVKPNIARQLFEKYNLTVEEY
jgi:hypothetical protein